MTQTCSASASEAPKRIAILSKRYMPLDEQLGRLLETQLAGYGYQVFTDKHLNVGVEWATELEQQLRSVDAVIPLISSGSSFSEMLAYEIELAHEAAFGETQQDGLGELVAVEIAALLDFGQVVNHLLRP